MSRRQQQQPPLDATQPELEDEEVISGTGEGDEAMEDVQDQEEGYSEFPCVDLGRRAPCLEDVHIPSILSLP